MGGDGEFFAHNGSLAGARTIVIPSGKGGGCVKSGPFKKYPIPETPNCLPNP
jgi:tyrosinase